MADCFYAPDLPLVTIGIPVYNGGLYLRASLNCLLEQDYPRLEIIIADNASTDETEAIATEFANTYPFIIYHRHPENIGAPANFMCLTQKARGKYFMWASTHDLWSPGLISRAVEAMEADSNVVLSYAMPYWIIPSGKKIPLETTLHDTRSVSKLTGFTLVLWGLTACPQFYGVHRLDVIKRLKPFRKVFGPDNLFLAELACKGSFALLTNEKFYMRQIADFNDWYAYFRKLKMQLTRHSPRELYHEFILAHLKLVNEEFSRPTEKLALFFIVWYCMLSKYYWIPEIIQGAYEGQLRASGSANNQTIVSQQAKAETG